MVFGFWYLVFGYKLTPKIIKFGQSIGPDICHFIDLSLAIGGNLGNMQIKKLPLRKM